MKDNKDYGKCEDVENFLADDSSSDENVECNNMISRGIFQHALLINYNWDKLLIFYFFTRDFLDLMYSTV